jgi:hypothetical protein
MIQAGQVEVQGEVKNMKDFEVKAKAINETEMA